MKTAIIFILFFSLPAFAKTLIQKNTFIHKDKSRTVTVMYPDTPSDPNYLHFNPFVFHDDAVVYDQMIFLSSQKKIYSTVYHTGKFGFRKTQTSASAKEHLILAGDSNMFGVGVADEETLPSRFAQMLPAKQVINMGLGGEGPSSLLYFLENYKLDPLLEKNRKGIMIYDFHHHLFDRVIGSKVFLSWSKQAPRYILEEGKVRYAGFFEDYWLARFYLFLNKLPYNEILFPNLPRINHEHIVLTAKVLAEIKKHYLAQTSPENRFIVSFNPAYTARQAARHLQDLRQELEKEKIEMVVFSKEEIKPLPIIAGEYHQSAQAHLNYSEMLNAKLKLTLSNK